MKKTEMKEFQWTLGNECRCTTDQFNNWMKENASDYPEFKITHIQVISGETICKSPMETLYIVFEYD